MIPVGGGFYEITTNLHVALDNQEPYDYERGEHFVFSKVWRGEKDVFIADKDGSLISLAFVNKYNREARAKLMVVPKGAWNDTSRVN